MKKVISVILIAAFCTFALTGCKANDYKDAVALIESKDYAGAAEILTALGEYKDAADLLAECNKWLDAFSAFDGAVKELEAKNGELTQAADEADALVYGENKALDETLRTEAESALTEARTAMTAVPERPEEYDELVSATEQMNGTDYSEVLARLIEKTEALDRSVRQYELVNNPSEEYVVNCLKEVEGVMEVAAATEDHDPNGHLHKAGGYTSAVYFSHELVDQSKVDGPTVIDKGTDCGGQIEVYANVEDAVKRNEYLAIYDGTIYRPGSHTVIGTVIVRISDKLTASQQKELEAKIIEILTRID